VEHPWDSPGAERVMVVKALPPRRPGGGHGFYRGGFDEKILKAYYAEIQPKTIGILCAGNAIARYNYAQDFDKTMKQLKDYWTDVGVAIVFIDAVPHRFRDSEL
jgi:hypothetical protein